MIEIPESNTYAQQLNETINQKKIVGIITNHSPHKFAFFYDDDKNYLDLLKGKDICKISSFGGQVVLLAKTRCDSVNESEDEDKLEDEDKARTDDKARIDDKASDNEILIALADDAQIRYIYNDEKVPEKHQLLITFEDASKLVVSARMYAQIHVCPSNTYDNKYYEIAIEKPSPLSDDFTMNYFENLFDEVKPNTSLKSFLATKQRIPGIGNGTLQDILFNAKLHPKTKIKKLSNEQKEDLFNSVKNTLKVMTEQGGRNTEKTLFGDFGRYEVIFSSKTFKKPCPVCGGKINKESYLGGVIYYCPYCQKLDD